MKVLLIGPYPPPHGGISVHIAGISEQLTDAGIRNEVLDLGRVTNWFAYTLKLARYARGGWVFHFHANGHNWKSWMLALSSGLCRPFIPGGILTVHSGMAPDYLASCFPWSRALVALVCRLHSRTICVSPQILSAVLDLGLPAERAEVLPARIDKVAPRSTPDPRLESWMESHTPVLSTALFFQGEYGFELLASGMVRLLERYPSAGCVVMGSGTGRSAAEGMLDDHGLRNSILLTGDVAHDACLSVIASSDVFVRPTFTDGDSISVREALFLQVPVVASSVGMRPAGTILFQPGDVDSLLAAIEAALAAPHPQAVAGTGCFERLLISYEWAAASGKDLCPA